MRRRKGEDEHENLERWLITYADLITLLLAFFIMMYTFSKQDAQKYEEVSGSLKTIFSGGSGVLKAGTGRSSTTNPMSTSGSNSEVKRQLENEVQAMAGPSEKDPSITISKDERGIVIRIMDRAIFDEGKAELKESARETLKNIVPIMKNSNRSIRVEGHTDDVPINTSEFKSNWELSARRATEVVRHLVERYSFPPQRISASGYAEYQPITKNDTPQHRALNRRIEVILLESSNPGTQTERPISDPPKGTVQ
jgi:chemotaxis protein MotB